MDEIELRLIFNSRRAIDDARKAIRLARQRSEPVSVLLSRLRSANKDQLSDVVYALQEKSGNPLTDMQIVASLTEFSDYVDTLPSSERSRLDSAIGRIMRRLDPTSALPLAILWAKHRRKGRRLFALKILAKISLNDEIIELLLKRFRETQEKDFLKPIIRAPFPSFLNVEEFFEAFKFDEDDYWQALVAESALRTDERLAPKLLMNHTHATIWAAGRLNMRQLVPDIMQAFYRSNDKISILGITVWALGKLGAQTQILELEHVIDDLDNIYSDH